jgi:hypothetical protein
VSLWNQVLISASGLVIAVAVFLCGMVLQRPEAVKDAFKEIFDLK